MKNLSNLRDLLQYQLQNIFDAENQLIKALPLFQESVSNRELKKIFSLHLDETKMHQERIFGMAQDLDFNLKDKTCSGMQRLIRQANKFCNITGGQFKKDAGLIAYAQQIEQYEIAIYKYMIRYAQKLDYPYLTKFLQQNQAEELNAYESLTNLSMDNFKSQTRNYFAA